MIRFFDLLISLIGLIILSPLFIFIIIWIYLDSGRPVFYKQLRVGVNDCDFFLIKFRTMYQKSDIKLLLTVGNNDSRITRSGKFLRKHKLDELPQLINVLTGQMSIVGPRPEVRKYVDLYTAEQKKVMSVKPGISDWASIKYKDENDLLAAAADPEAYYINIIMPEKIRYNMIFINHKSLSEYFKIILTTITRLLLGHRS